MSTTTVGSVPPMTTGLANGGTSTSCAEETSGVMVKDRDVRR